MADNQPQMDGFTLGRPAIVCRWRLANRALPLENRHLRALSRRRLGDKNVSTQLVAWAKQHIEWTLAEGSARYPDGVLMLIIDEEGRAAMTVGPFEPLAQTTAQALSQRALSAEHEAAVTGVAPEGLWAVRGDQLICGGPTELPLSGAASLIRDLARTTGLSVACDAGLAQDVAEEVGSYDELFLVSDEFGVVPASDAKGPRSYRLAGGYARLLEKRRQ